MHPSFKITCNLGEGNVQGIETVLKVEVSSRLERGKVYLEWAYIGIEGQMLSTAKLTNGGGRGCVSLLVVRLIVCAIHPFPGAITVSETYPVIEGLSVLFKEFLESKQKGRF